MSTVEDEHRGRRVEPVDDVTDGLTDPDHRHCWLHELADRAIKERRVVERLVHHLELAYTEVAHECEAATRGLVGGDEHQVGDRTVAAGVLGPENVTGGRSVPN